ncbi:hypothetical protein K450DRAFT_234943 [Umbelopsis ramanniana AG]|uniref:BHLH domain-containing protein n=1 Tax=Umbelopsis ramanniana AG TaxID=1314678 RepID=A0AAD5EDA0_UMBRA|nr:uncharacterized protein K450DRAFT_234943 [Umbelopsis ramanniana AG]KAI8580865.1 hypothetical protein K450DRAFT_234943 [Umbelopsis ramanniana AG]
MLERCDHRSTPDLQEHYSNVTGSDNYEENRATEHKTENLDAGGMFINFSSDMSDSGFKAKRKYKRAYKVNGVNILNRSEIDSKTMMERLRKRKENHNHIERKRRDHINHTIFELAEILPQIQSRASTPTPSYTPTLTQDPNSHPNWEPRFAWAAEQSPSLPLERLHIRSAPSTPRHNEPSTMYFHAHPVLPSPQPNILRPILPKHPSAIGKLRMSGLESQYSGACRY